MATYILVTVSYDILVISVKRFERSNWLDTALYKKNYL